MTQLQHRALEVALEISKEAAALVMEGFRSGAHARKKGAIDLVTEFDLRSEELVRERLSKAFPDHRLVGEEQPPTGESNYAWYIDPIDGTTNYSHGHPMFCVSLALYESGVGMVGVVCAPALGVTWWASQGEGAYRNGERCYVSATEDMDNALCATGFPYDRRTSQHDNIAEYRAFMKRSQGVRRCGAAALDLAMVADGTYDLFWEGKLHPWDFAAGAIIVQEAAGQVSDYSGKKIHFDSKTLLATNGHLHAQGTEILRGA